MNTAKRLVASIAAAAALFTGVATAATAVTTAVAATAVVTAQADGAPASPDNTNWG